MEGGWGEVSEGCVGRNDAQRIQACPSRHATNILGEAWEGENQGTRAGGVVNTSLLNDRGPNHTTGKTGCAMGRTLEKLQYWTRFV